MGEIIKRFCPVCKEEREFRRVIEAHKETEPFTMHTPMGSPLRTWIQTTEHPTAYCSVCSIVVYVGPDAEKIERQFNKREEKKQRTIRI